MFDGNVSDNSGIQKRNWFATQAAPSEETAKKTRGSPIAASCDHVNCHAVTLLSKLTKMVVLCAADFMTRLQNIHYNISSQRKLKSNDRYIPKSNQIKLDLPENHKQVITKWQLKLKSLVIEAGDLDLVGKQKVAIISLVESVYDISEGILTYDDRKDIYTHQCLIDIIELYNNYIAVHLSASKEILLKDYRGKKNSKICLLRVSPAPRQQPLQLILLLLNLPPQKPLESLTGAFSMRETPHLRQLTTQPRPLSWDQLKVIRHSNPTPL